MNGLGGSGLLNWAEGLLGFGPEALIEQVASRPVSFDAWVDLLGDHRLEVLPLDTQIKDP